MVKVRRKVKPAVPETEEETLQRAARDLMAQRIQEIRKFAESQRLLENGPAGHSSTLFANPLRSAYVDHVETLFREIARLETERLFEKERRLRDGLNDAR